MNCGSSIMYIVKYMQNYRSYKVRFFLKVLLFISCNPVGLMCPTFGDYWLRRIHRALKFWCNRFVTEMRTTNKQSMDHLVAMIITSIWNAISFL